MAKKDYEVYKTESELKELAQKELARQAAYEAAHPAKPLTQKRQNFWYHYKWHTIGGAFALLLLIFIGRDMFFRVKPDTTIVMVAQAYYMQEDLTELTAKLESAATDYNGDKKVSILVDYINLTPQDEDNDSPGAMIGDPQQAYANSMKLMAVVAAAADPVFLLDDAAYAQLSSMSDEALFTPLQIPVESLGLNDAAAFAGMRFYLRSGEPWAKKAEYYAYCQQLLQQLADQNK